MTDQTPKRITIDAPSEATILAARHLDATEGRVQIGATVDPSTRSAITCVLRYIAKAHNSPAAIPTHEVSRYDQLSPLARALVDDYDALDLAKMLVAAQNDIASCKTQQWPQRLARAERERDLARQHAAAIAAQRDRLRQRMNNLADRWERDAPPPGNRPLTELREEISCDPFDPEGAMTVQEYTERGRRLWAFRCWGTDTCDGWLGLEHPTQTSALAERERHVAETHIETGPRDTGCQRARAERAEATVARVRAAVHIADEQDVTDWQRGYRACAERALAALDQSAPAATDAAEPAAWTPPPPGDRSDRHPGTAVTRPANAHRVRPIPPLPARTRLRLAATRRIDHLGAWLCGHGHPGAALRIWRTCHMI